MDLHPIQPASISMDLHPIQSVEFNQSNLTGRIGCKSIEIMTTKFNQEGRQCNLNGFPPNLTGQI